MGRSLKKSWRRSSGDPERTAPLPDGRCLPRSRRPREFQTIMGLSTGSSLAGDPPAEWAKASLLNKVWTSCPGEKTPLSQCTGETVSSPTRDTGTKIAPRRSQDWDTRPAVPPQLAGTKQSSPVRRVAPLHEEPIEYIECDQYAIAKAVSIPGETRRASSLDTLRMVRSLFCPIVSNVPANCCAMIYGLPSAGRSRPLQNVIELVF
ncbi:hypothetical protein GWK47_022454 [Chionoecetes opilio]|uniref:Uncharacterized protein n=1 Tax=Chionoecetes opilio TaxID=41210 RepID=A0A8J4XN07_CHIOP|nr:hypothetical protein GWK47_022454 [Chionoecetes opilio]